MGAGGWWWWWCPSLIKWPIAAIAHHQPFILLPPCYEYPALGADRDDEELCHVYGDDVDEQDGEGSPRAGLSY